MEFAAEDILTWVNALIWPFVRISALLLSAPIFGARSLNTQTRLALGLLLSLMLAPQLPVPTVVDPLSIAGLLLAAQQVVIGITMGFILQMVFSALVQAGEAIALSMGLGFAAAMDPVGGVQVPMVSQFYQILATLIFLSLNGHLMLIELLMRSFILMPIGGDLGISADSLWRVVLFGAAMYAGALLIAIPAVASLLLINLAMGVITRAAPQLNIFAVGFPMTLLAGFVIITLTLPTLPARIGDLMAEGFRLIQEVLGF